MKFSIQRVIAASIPAVLLAGTNFAADAAPSRSPLMFNAFGARPFASTATALGGGATLPVPAYLGKSVSGGYESSGQTSFGVTGSIFGYFASQTGGLNIEYCATGSGKGKGVFDGAANTVDIACANAASASATTYGFLPPSGSPRQTYPTLAGTDAPLAQTEYSSYTANHAAPREPVELPSIYGSIAVVYNDSAEASKRLTLTNNQICGAFNGTYKTFGAMLGNSDKTPIVVVYRGDGSGTSFNFSNHLASAPSAANCTGFGANQTFATADPSLPSNAVAGTGNGGVIAAINKTAGAIGYIEAGYTTPSTGAGAITYANVVNPTNNTAYDPFTGLPAAANSVSASNLLTNVAVNQTAAHGGPSTTSALTGVRSGSCVKVLNPAAYAKPSTGYPIVAVTYLLFNSAGNGSSDTALRLLEKDLTTPSLFKHPGATTPITTVDEAEPAVTSGTTGYSSLGTTFASTIQATANACINV